MTIAQRLADAGVEVKPLEWEETVTGRYIGTPPVKLGDMAFWIFMRAEGYVRHLNGGGKSVHTTLEAAKSAAQADYTARILSALQEVKP